MALQHVNQTNMNVIVGSALDSNNVAMATATVKMARTRVSDVVSAKKEKKIALLLCTFNNVGFGCGKSSF